MEKNTKEMAKAFARHIMTDAAVLAAVEEAMALPNDERLVRLAEIARSAGYDFSVDELAALQQTAGITVVKDAELTDQELDKVAGGGFIWGGKIGGWGKKK